MQPSLMSELLDQTRKEKTKVEDNPFTRLLTPKKPVPVVPKTKQQAVAEGFFKTATEGTPDKNPELTKERKKVAKTKLPKADKDLLDSWVFMSQYDNRDVSFGSERDLEQRKIDPTTPEYDLANYKPMPGAYEEGLRLMKTPEGRSMMERQRANWRSMRSESSANKHEGKPFPRKEGTIGKPLPQTDEEQDAQHLFDVRELWEKSKDNGSGVMGFLAQPKVFQKVRDVVADKIADSGFVPVPGGVAKIVGKQVDPLSKGVSDMIGRIIADNLMGGLPSLEYAGDPSNPTPDRIGAGIEFGSHVLPIARGPAGVASDLADFGKSLNRLASKLGKGLSEAQKVEIVSKAAGEAVEEMAVKSGVSVDDLIENLERPVTKEPEPLTREAEAVQEAELRTRLQEIEGYETNRYLPDGTVEKVVIQKGNIESINGVPHVPTDKGMVPVDEVLKAPGEPTAVKPKIEPETPSVAQTAPKTTSVTVLRPTVPDGPAHTWALDDLDKAISDYTVYEKELDASVLGDKLPEWKRANRLMESPSSTTDQMTEGSRIYDEILRNLTPEQQDALFGIGQPHTADDLRALRGRMGHVASAQTPEELAWFLGGSKSVNDPLAIQRATNLAKEKGWDFQAIKEMTAARIALSEPSLAGERLSNLGMTMDDARAGMKRLQSVDAQSITETPEAPLRGVQEPIEASPEPRGRERIEAARKRLEARGKKLPKNAGGSPLTGEDLEDLLDIGRGLIEEGIDKIDSIADFIEKFVSNAGEWARPHAKQVWEYLNGKDPGEFSRYTFAELEKFKETTGYSLTRGSSVTESEILRGIANHSNAEDAHRLLDEAVGSKSPLNEVNQAIVGSYMRKVEAALDDVSSRLLDAEKAGEDTTALSKEYEALNNEMNDLLLGWNYTGSAAGAGLQGRKTYYSPDGRISTANEVEKWKKSLGRDLTPEETGMIEAAAKEDAKLRAELASAKRAQGTPPKEAVKNVNGRLKVIPKGKQPKVDALDTLYSDAVKRLSSSRAKGKTSGSTSLPSDISDLAIIAAYNIRKLGLRSLSEIKDAMGAHIPDITDDEVFHATQEALDALYPNRPPIEKAERTILDLKKEVESALRTGTGDYDQLTDINQRLGALKAQIRAGLTPDQWEAAMKEMRRLAIEAGAGRKFSTNFIGKIDSKGLGYGYESPSVVATRRKLDALRYEFNQSRRAKEIEEDYNAANALKKFYMNARTVYDIPRQIRASFDDSAPGRQGLFGVIINPKGSWKAFKEHYKTFKAGGLEQSMSDMNAHHGVDTVDRNLSAGLKIHTPGMREEQYAQFSSPPLRKLVGLVEKGTGWSERLFTSFLSWQRMDTMNKLVDVLELRLGKEASEEQLKLIADFVNSATGASASQKEKMGKIFNNVFWAPGWVGSRFKLIVPTHAIKALSENEPEVAALLAKNSAKIYLGIGAMLSLAKLSGAKVTTDPNSSDFGKAVWGDVHVDLSGGLGSIAGLAGKLTEDVSRGDLLGAGAHLWKFTSSKFHPTLAAVVFGALGKNAMNEDTTLKNELNKLVQPLPIQNAWENQYDKINSPNPKLQRVGATASDVIGFSSQIYSPDPESDFFSYAKRIARNVKRSAIRQQNTLRKIESQKPQ